MPICRSIRLLCVFLLSATVGRAQLATGIQNHGTMISKGADVINAGNNNIFLNIPIVNKQGRGAPFSYSASLNSSIWYPVNSGSSTTWQPVAYDGSALGWQGINVQASVGVSYAETVSAASCGPSGATFHIYQFSPIGYLAAAGGLHTLKSSAGNMVYFVSTPGSGCPPTGPAGPGPSVTIASSDGAGYTGTMSFASNTSSNPTVVFQLIVSGITINPPSTAAQGGYSGPLTTTDTNGNQVSENAGQYTDTTGSSVLSISYLPARSGPPNPDGKVVTYPAQTNMQYNIPGGTASYQVIYGTYSVATNFGCAGIGEYGPVSTSLVSQIVAPDGSTYQFQYEPTPGGNGSVTGRIGYVVLPTGGTILYQYSGGNNGISCGDGTTPTLTRTTTDGVETFAKVMNGSTSSTNTVTDEKGNKTVYNFSFPAFGQTAAYETHRKVYQGPQNTALLEEIATCYYNGSQSSCYGQSINLPATEIDSTSSFNGGSQLLTKTTYDSTGVVVTNVAQYSGSTLLENTANSYTIAPPLYNLNSTTVTDGSGTLVALTNYKYDEGSVTPTSNVPQHTTVSGARGNLTSTHVQYDSNASDTLNSSTVYYDTGLLASTTTMSGTTTYTYDPTQTLSSMVSTGLGLSTGATFDAASGAMLTGTGMNPEQTLTVAQYNSSLRPVIVTPASEPQKSYVYVPYSLTSPTQATVTQGPSIGTTQASTSTTQYDTYGRISRTARYNGQSATTAYYQTDYCYDPAGLLSFQSMPYAGPGLGSQGNSPKQCTGAGTTYTYDALGRVLTTQAATANGSVTEGTTTSYSNLTVKTSDVNQIQKLTQYDLLGRISSVCEVWTGGTMPSSGTPVSCGTDFPGINGYLTQYAYVLSTHTTTITQGAQTRTFQTDFAGRTIYTNEPERGATQYAYTYNSTGLAVSRTRPTANQTSTANTTATVTQYDALGRPVSVSYTYTGITPSIITPSKQFLYDQASANGGTAYNKGMLTTASTLQGTLQITSTQLDYDILGNVSDTMQCMPNNCANAAFNVLRNYVTDPVLGTRQKETYFSGGASSGEVDTTMTYSPAGELLTMANTLTGASYNNGSILSNMQNSVYGPTGYTLGNGLNGIQTYDGLGRSSGVSICANSTAFGCSGGTQTYQMTQSISGGRVAAMSDSVMGSGITPNYDSFNRLSAISYGSSGLAFSYTYDRYGNRWSQTATQGSGPSPQVSFNVNTNQNTSMGYDAAGNMTSDRTHSYYYDAEGNVVSVDGGATATYIYDALNHRVRVTTSSADTYYTFNTDGLRVASWNATASSPTLLTAYAYWNGRPIATYTAGTVSYPQLDLLGTKRLITTSTGSTGLMFQSLPFGDGVATNGSGTDTDPSHFALLDHDNESGTEHAQSRQYNSSPGSWMSPDPYDGSYDGNNPQSFNRYIYALNSPLSYVDPSGLDSQVTCETTFTVYNGQVYYGHTYCTNEGDDNPNPTPGSTSNVGAGEAGDLGGNGETGSACTGGGSCNAQNNFAQIQGRSPYRTPQQCQALADKINNILKDIASSQFELNTNPLNLPQMAPGRSAGSVYGHQTDLGKKIQNLGAVADEYHAGCGGGPPGPPANGSLAPSPVPIVVPPIMPMPLPMTGGGPAWGEILEEILAGLLALA